MFFYVEEVVVKIKKVKLIIRFMRQFYYSWLVITENDRFAWNNNTTQCHFKCILFLVQKWQKRQ